MNVELVIPQVNQVYQYEPATAWKLTFKLAKLWTEFQNSARQNKEVNARGINDIQ